MEITKHNFNEYLPKIQEAIQNANFISIDGEFTGISSLRNINHFDTPEERYQKLKESTGSSYLLIQFGLCTFHYNQDTGSYHHKAFNFYIFPSESCRPNQEVCFLSQPSSLKFLISQGFDFNKLIRDGIPFMATEGFIKLKAKLQERHKDQLRQLDSKPDPVARTNIPVPEENKEFIQKVEDDIKAMLASEQQNSLELLPCNGFLRRLVYELAEKYPEVQISTKSVPESREKFLRVEKKSKEADFYVEELKTKQKQELEELEDSVGFCKVITAIAKANTLLVGHNMLLDILNLIRQFVCPLPQNYKDFKSLVTCALNHVIDTKLVASCDPFKDIIKGTSLAELVSQLQSSPFKLKNIEPSGGFEGYVLNQGQLHEAGYDAFITGAALIALHQHLCKVSKVTEPISRQSKVLAPFINKVFMMQSYDLNYLNLASADQVPSRNQVFHVQFPREWKNNDLIELFSNYGSIFISWLNDTSAYVCLRQPDKAANVLQDLVQKSSNPKISVVPYSAMRKQKQQKNGSRKHSLSDQAVSTPSKKMKTCKSNEEKATEEVPPESGNPVKKPQSCPTLFEEPAKWD